MSAGLQFVIESWILYWTETFNFSNNFCRLDLNDIWDHGNLVVCCKTSDFQIEDCFDAPRYGRRPAQILNQQFHTLPGKLPATEENVKIAALFNHLNLTVSSFDEHLNAWFLRKGLHWKKSKPAQRNWICCGGISLLLITGWKENEPWALRN